MSDQTCPHCSHSWVGHTTTWLGGHRRCHCGCYWQPPKPPAPEPTEHDLLVAKVRAAMYAELDWQHEEGVIGAAGYWDPDWGRLDGEPDWDRVAEAAITAVRHAGD